MGYERRNFLEVNIVIVNKMNEKIKIKKKDYIEASDQSARIEPCMSWDGS